MSDIFLIVPPHRWSSSFYNKHLGMTKYINHIFLDMATTPPRFPDRHRRLVVTMMLVARVMVSRLRCIKTPGADRSCMAIDVVVSQRRRRRPCRLHTPRRLRSVNWYVDSIDIDHRHPDNDTHHQTTTRRAIRCALPSLRSSMSTRDKGRRHRILRSGRCCHDEYRHRRQSRWLPTRTTDDDDDDDSSQSQSSSW